MTAFKAVGGSIRASNSIKHNQGGNNIAEKRSVFIIEDT